MCGIKFFGIDFIVFQNTGSNNKLKEVIPIRYQTKVISVSEIKFPRMAVNPQINTQIWRTKYAFFSSEDFNVLNSFLFSFYLFIRARYQKN